MTLSTLHKDLTWGSFAQHDKSSQDQATVILSIQTVFYPTGTLSADVQDFKIIYKTGILKFKFAIYARLTHLCSESPKRDLGKQWRPNQIL